MYVPVLVQIREQSDVEREPGAVQLLGRFAGEVCADHGRRQAGVGDHPVGDPVAEVDQHPRSLAVTVLHVRAAELAASGGQLLGV